MACYRVRRLARNSATLLPCLNLRWRQPNRKSSKVNAVPLLSYRCPYRKPHSRCSASENAWTDFTAFGTFSSAIVLAMDLSSAAPIPNVESVAIVDNYGRQPAVQCSRCTALGNSGLCALVGGRPQTPARRTLELRHRRPTAEPNYLTDLAAASSRCCRSRITTVCWLADAAPRAGTT